MRHSLLGRRLLLTGATGGIGRALAHAFIDRGARIGLLGRQPDKLTALSRELNAPDSQILLIKADLTSESDRNLAVKRMQSEWGGIDLLINNAGIGSFGHFVDSDPAILRKVMEVNFFAPAELIRCALPLLRLSAGSGVVNIASMCGRRALPAWSEYSASKYALCGLADSLRAELARFDIRMLLVVPGLTQTGLGDNLLRNEGRMQIDFADGMDPKYVADMIVSAVERGKQELTIGRDAKLLIRVNRLLPWLVNVLMARKVRALYSDEIRARKAQESNC